MDWCPAAGVNCLIGPGDSGKSTILDAIDYCLGARRNLAIADTDFHALDVTQSISISVTLGDLPDSMLSIETFGEYLRGFDAPTGMVEDEPRKGAGNGPDGPLHGQSRPGAYLVALFPANG